MIPLSFQVLSRQLQVFGRYTALANSDLRRRIILSNDNIVPCNSKINRKRRRPKFQWSNVLHAIIWDMFKYDQSEAKRYFSASFWKQSDWKIFCQAYVYEWYRYGY